MYCRYIDDIFVVVENVQQLEELRRIFQESSCLRFTVEENSDGTLPFLDVLVTARERQFETTVYTKQTNMGMCMNADSEAPKRYKKSVINSYINRAFTHCSSWHSWHNEIERVTQILVNNGYSNNEIQEATKRKLNNFLQQRNQNAENETNKITLYYRNYMSSAHEMDEKVIKDIIKRGISPTDSNKNIDLCIYYRNFKTSNLVMKNNLCAKTRPLDKCGVVYQYSCQIANCKSQNTTYIGMCTTSLSRRLTTHLANGGIEKHTRNEHNVTLTRDMLVQNTIILDKIPDRRKLQYLEALYINLYKPIINIQGGFHAIALPSSRL